MNTSQEKMAPNSIDRILAKLSPREKTALINYVNSVQEQRQLAATLAAGMLASHKWGKEQLPNVAKLALDCAEQIVKVTSDKLYEE